MLKENKGIIISGILLTLLSQGFTAVINLKVFYNGGANETIICFVRAMAYICVSCMAFVLANKYGRKPALKYGRVFVPIGIILSAVADAQGCMNIFGYSIEIVTLTNTFAVLGLATYFYRYCLKSVLHTSVFWVASFLFLIVSERGYLTFVLFVMIGLMLILARKNKLISKKSVWILNVLLYILLIFRTINITLMGIAELTNLFYDSSYMAFIARCTYMKIKWFGAAVDPWLIGGDVAYYKLLWVFGLFGIVAGVIVFTVLAVFTFFVCKKCFNNVLTDTTPIAYVAASILLVRFTLSMLTNFGIVLGGLFAPIPVLSDGICGYIAIFAMTGLLLSENGGGADNGINKNKGLTDMSY